MSMQPRKTAPPRPGEMGVDPITVLSVVLGSAAAVQLVKTLHVWVKTSRPSLKIKFKTGTSEVEIDAQNLPDQQVLVDKIVTQRNC